MRKVHRGLLVFIIIIFLPIKLIAQDIRIENLRSFYDVYENDSIVFDLKVHNVSKNLKINFPQLPHIKFRYLGNQGSFQSTVIRNSQISKTQGVNISIEVKGSKIGTYKIPYIKVVDNNKIFHSKPFIINIKNIPQGDTIQINVSSVKNTLYVNEIVRLKVQFYFSANVKNYNIDFPLLSDKNFYWYWDELPSNTQKKQLVIANKKVNFESTSLRKNNTQYLVLTRSLAFYPRKEGFQKLFPIVLKADVIDGHTYQKDIFGFRRKIEKTRRVIASSETINLNVKPIQTPIPPYFNNSVGVFTMNTGINFTQVKVGEPLHLSIRLQGEGNFFDMDNPILQQLEKDFVVVSPPKEKNISITGSEWVFIIKPKNSTIIEVPALTMQYFHPYIDNYITTESFSLTLDVEEAEFFDEKDIITNDNLEKSKILPTISHFTLNELHKQWYEKDIFFWMTFLLSPFSFSGILFYKKIKNKKQTPNIQLEINTIWSELRSSSYFTNEEFIKHVKQILSNIHLLIPYNNTAIQQELFKKVEAIVEDVSYGANSLTIQKRKGVLTILEELFNEK